MKKPFNQIMDMINSKINLSVKQILIVYYYLNFIIINIKKKKFF